MNAVLFVQHQSNQPVKIETYYRPSKATTLTLHAVVDGVKGPALEPDLPISTLSTGLAAKTALIIKSKSDMDVYSSSPTAGSGKSSRSSINKEVIQLDSIDLNTEHLGRRELLAKLAGLVAEHRFVRLTSQERQKSLSKQHVLARYPRMLAVLMQLFNSSKDNVRIGQYKEMDGSLSPAVSVYDILENVCKDTNARVTWKKFKNGVTKVDHKCSNLMDTEASPSVQSMSDNAA
ncbi:hypothetical protein BJ741DRAFT_663090 [Chytriomyces cf. hyalinus JEL632]|nr:hypothetical protein BJ741DRAFT_663090 [Chytriomyces cf. hyalinus JEL632]